MKCGTRVSAKAQSRSSRGVYEAVWRLRWSTRRIRGYGWVWKDGVANVRGDGNEKRVAILDGCALGIEVQVADPLDGHFVICDADVIVFDSELRGSCSGVVTPPSRTTHRVRRRLF